MNLIIEQGNTAVKVAVYDGGKMLISSVYKVFGWSGILPFLEQYPLKNGILSSVTRLEKEWIDGLKERLDNFLVPDEWTKLPIEIRYRTPETLGKDRIAAATGANLLYPDRDVLVIDAGTAITYEMVEAPGVYVGGNISPGMTTRFRALHHFTEKLPLVWEQEDIPLLGTTTESAIQAGVVNGIVWEMDGYIDAVRKKYPNVFVILTGGHSFYFKERLRNAVFAAINLALDGLNRILEYNIKEKNNVEKQ
ncbi:MAG: type III pantothenate kinase [Tannerella sp.]|nr:type III pantothenate kinase [Tannerella sp.]